MIHHYKNWGDVPRAGETLHLHGREYRAVDVLIQGHGKFWSCQKCEFEREPIDDDKECRTRKTIIVQGGPDCFDGHRSVIWVKPEKYEQVVAQVVAARITGQPPDEDEE